MQQEKACLFCRISSRQLEAEIVAEGDDWLAFNDIHPKAPVHILVIPKKHIASLAEAELEDSQVLGELLLAVADIAKDQEIDDDGYRTVINTRSHGGQEVDHLHVHLLGGEPLGPMRSQEVPLK